MNAPSKKPQAAETVENVLDEMDKRATDNLRIWSALSKTDPAQTKGFSRAGGFKGTAVKPMWVIKRLTEQFGPCGSGWGIDEPKFEVVPGDGETLVFCTVRCWYDAGDAGIVNNLHGVGGDKVCSVRSGKPFYDDEAFKKAFTDAVNNAFKFVGVAADIHMGLFEDSKYVAEVTAEFHPPQQANDPTKPGAKEKDGDFSPTALRGAIKMLVRNINGCGSVRDLEELLELQDAKDTIEQCARRFPAWWETGEGCPAEFTPLKKLIEQTREGLRKLTEDEEQEFASAALGEDRNNR
jgi:hypothetical protein